MGSQSHETGRPSWNNNSTTYGAYSNFGQQTNWSILRACGHWRYFNEDTVYTDEKNNNFLFPTISVVWNKPNRNKDNQRIEIRKEVKKAKISTTTYKKKK